MTITTGTRDTRTEHSEVRAALNLTLAMGGPAALALAGIIAMGWGAISWTGAVVWGIVATAAFTAVSLMGKAMGMTRMDLLGMLGSVFVKPGSRRAPLVGAVVHHMNGALLAVAWAYGVALVGLPANVATAMLWGLVLTGLALLMMTSIGAAHPQIRSGCAPDPGPAATHFGRLTPLGSLMGHLVYGLVLGFAYQQWPL